MKINELEKFRFNIGNTTNDLEGILVDEELDGEYDDVDILDAHDLKNAIDDAILNCTSLNDEDRDELGTYLGAEIDIDSWWDENYN